MSYNNDYDTAKTIEDKGKLSASNYFKQTVLDEMFVSPQNPYVKTLIPTVMVFRGETF